MPIDRPPIRQPKPAKRGRGRPPQTPKRPQGLEVIGDPAGSYPEEASRVSRQGRPPRRGAPNGSTVAKQPPIPPIPPAPPNRLQTWDDLLRATQEELEFREAEIPPSAVSSTPTMTRSRRRAPHSADQWAQAQDTTVGVRPDPPFHPWATGSVPGLPSPTLQGQSHQGNLEGVGTEEIVGDNATPDYPQPAPPPVSAAREDFRSIAAAVKVISDGVWGNAPGMTQRLGEHVRRIASTLCEQDIPKVVPQNILAIMAIPSTVPHMVFPHPSQLPEDLRRIIALRLRAWLSDQTIVDATVGLSRAWTSVRRNPPDASRVFSWWLWLAYFQALMEASTTFVDE